MLSQDRKALAGMWRVNRLSNEVADVFIYGDIGGWMDGLSANDFAREVVALDVGNLNVRLNSGGGSVFEGQAIYNTLSQHKAKVTVTIDGVAASIASVIAMAGDEIRITEGSHIMVHKPWSMAMGDADSMRKEADVLDSLESGIIDIYAARTGKNTKQLTDWVSAETWFKGQAAVDAGFADSVIPAKRRENYARSNIFNSFLHTPVDILNELCNIPHVRELERVLRDVEGFSQTQAKRIIALTQQTDFDYRDGDGRQEAAEKLAVFLQDLTGEIGNGRSNRSRNAGVQSI